MINIMDTPSLLVAGTQLRDPNFQQSVILLIEHNHQGALGFVINKLAPYNLADVTSLTGDRSISENIAVWNGGPVDKDRGIVLHNRRVSSDDRCVGSLNIYLSDTEESIHRLCDFEATYLGGGDYVATSEIPAINSFRFILGYAGWGPKQLLQEIELGAWFVLPYSERILFETPHDMIWSEAMQILSINKDSIITQSNFTIQ